jgi:hypothetical protein
VAGFVVGLRFYKGPGHYGPYIGALWTLAGVQLANLTFPDDPTTGWQVCI